MLKTNDVEVGGDVLYSFPSVDRRCFLPRSDERKRLDGSCGRALFECSHSLTE